MYIYIYSLHYPVFVIKKIIQRCQMYKSNIKIMLASFNDQNIHSSNYIHNAKNNQVVKFTAPATAIKSETKKTALGAY